MSVFVLSLEEVFRTYVPGSYDWSWEDEFEDLKTRELPYVESLCELIRTQGQIEPILLGEDGRVWDGHHRLLALSMLGQSHVRATLSTDA